MQPGRASAYSWAVTSSRRRAAIRPASLLVLGVIALSGCVTLIDVECVEDSNCDLFAGGLCHTNPATSHRWCTYPDEACSTGHRYSELSGDGLESTCTGEPPARCDPTKDFGEPTLLPFFNSAFDDRIEMTRDELLAFVYRFDGTSTTILTSRRASASDEFPPPSPDPSLVAIIAAPGTEGSFSLTADGLVAYFVRQPPAEAPDIFVAKRSAPSGIFGEGTRVTVGLSPLMAVLDRVSISADGQTLYWLDYYDANLRSATRTNAIDRFGNQTASSVANAIYSHVISEDELTLFYSDGFLTDILVTTRFDRTIPFGTGVPLSNVNSPQQDTPLFLTVDGCLLYLASRRPGGLGGFDIWVSHRPR